MLVIAVVFFVDCFLMSAILIVFNK